jgi:hypothetical protein
MSEPFKIDRKLPPHELNARRARKRVLPQLSPIFKRPIARDQFKEPKSSPNDHVFNHGDLAITHPE